MHNFYCSDLKQVSPGDAVILDKQEANHLFKILRAAPGFQVGLLDGQGCRGLAETGEGRTLTLLSKETVPEKGCRLFLYVAPPRKQKMDLLLKQAVELGVRKIVTMKSEFSVVLPGESSAERRSTLLLDACKQSGNPFLPECPPAMTFREALDDALATAPGGCLCGSPAKDDFRRTAFEGKLKNLKAIACFIGPEGGFSPSEEEAMEKAGFKHVKIGGNVLRVETAALGLLSVASYLAEGAE